MGLRWPEGGASAADQWQEVAERIAVIIRVSGLEVFRQAVRQVARERLEIDDHRHRREEARREAIKKTGVLYRDELTPEQPGREWFFHLETLRGSIKLPPEIALPPEPPKRPNPPACLRDHLPREGWSDTDRHGVETFHKAIATFKEQEREFWPQRAKAMLPIFEHVKQSGFPTHEEGGFPYEFDVCAWLPGDLNPVEDPQNERLLPVPKRALTETEKTAVLAAVYDAHWRGSEKVAPWGVSGDQEGPVAWPSDVERDERRAALGYHFLVSEAEELGTADLPIVRSWLEELKSLLPPQYSVRAQCDALSRNLRADDVPPSPRPPSDKAWQAWRLSKLLGISKQTEIAAVMVQQGTRASQGQVSRWLREIDDFLKAGGIAPKMDGLPTDNTPDGKPGSFDPGILDMGPRQGGELYRAHQQRLRRDPDSADE
jgi:hypothetical protein